MNQNQIDIILDMLDDKKWEIMNYDRDQEGFDEVLDSIQALIDKLTDEYPTAQPF